MIKQDYKSLKQAIKSSYKSYLFVFWEFAKKQKEDFDGNSLQDGLEAIRKIYLPKVSDKLFQIKHYGHKL